MAGEKPARYERNDGERPGPSLRIPGKPEDHSRPPGGERIENVSSRLRVDPAVPDRGDSAPPRSQVVPPGSLDHEIGQRPGTRISRAVRIEVDHKRRTSGGRQRQRRNRTEYVVLR